MAEQARTALSQYVGYEVTYDSVGMQLLDEWIDRHLKQFQRPSQKMRLLWVSFLGEMFRRHHNGEWVLQERDGGGDLVLLCSREGGDLHPVNVSGQVSQRIAHGMSASLAYFYAVTSIELKAEQ
jgi:hypothetical protein